MRTGDKMRKRSGGCKRTYAFQYMMVCIEREFIPNFMDPLTESFKIISVLTVASFSRTTTVCPSGSLKAADVSMGQPAVMHISPTLDMTSPIQREKAIDNRLYDDSLCNLLCGALSQTLQNNHNLDQVL
jgi:hypothetical protein